MALEFNRYELASMAIASLIRGEEEGSVSPEDADRQIEEILRDFPEIDQEQILADAREREGTA